MKKKLSWLRLAFFLIMTVVINRYAQAQVNVTIRVLPPYQSRITEYASRPDLVLLTLTNTSTAPVQVQLTGSITGDNGMSAWVSPGYRSPQPIDLAPGQALSLNGQDIAFLFDHNQIEYTGISRADFLRGAGLPEGTYQLCIQALDYATRQPLSPEAPMGCAQLVISNVEPPVVLTPFDGQEIRVTGATQVFPITWSTPPGAPPVTQYRVKIVEMIAPRNPNDAMQSAVTPPFFEEIVNVNTLLYGPAHPQLTPGRRYALMVQAIDPFGTTYFRNQGMSEVIAFTCAESPEPVVSASRADEQAPQERLQDSMIVTARMSYQYQGYTERYPYTGKVYLYETEAIDSVTFVRIGNPVAEAETDGEGNVRLPVPAPLIGGHYRLAFHNPYYQDPTEDIRLNVSTALKDLSTAGQVQNLQTRQNIGEVTAMVNSYSLKLTITRGYEYIRDIYYSSTIDQEVQREVNEEQRDANTLQEYLRTDTFAIVREALAGLHVSVYRRTRLPGLPGHEGDDLGANPGDDGLTLVAQDTTRLFTDDQGKRRAVADIERLLWSLSEEDLYQIRVTDPSNGEVIIDQSFRFHPAREIAGLLAEEMTPWHFTVQKGLSRVVEDPPLATLKGRILYRWFDGEGGTYPLAGKKIRLEPYYVFEDPGTGDMFPLSTEMEELIVPVDPLNRDKQVPPKERFGDRPPVVGASAETVTLSDGSFEFKDFALYDSVYTYEGSYNMYPAYIPPPQELPGQQIPGVQNPRGEGPENGSGLWTPEGGWSFPDVPGRELPDWVTDFLSGTGGGAGGGPGNVPGGPGRPGNPFGGGPGTPRMADAFAQAGMLSVIGQGINMREAKPALNTAVNGAKVVVGAGASALSMQEFHAAGNFTPAGRSGGLQQQLQQPAGRQRGGPSGPEVAWTTDDILPAAAPRAPGRDQLIYDHPMKLHRVFRIVVDDIRFLSPDDNIEINPLEQKDAGTLYSIVNSYKARVKVIQQNPDLGINMVQQRDEADGIRSRHDPEASIDQNDDPALLNIGLQLQKKSVRLPGDRQDDINEEAREEKLFSQLDADQNIFTHLVNHTEYRLTSQTNDTIQSNNAFYGTESEGLSGNANYNSQYSSLDNRQGLGNRTFPSFNAEFQQVTRDLFIILQPKEPVVAGRVLNDKGARAISGAVVELQIGEGPDAEHRYQTSDADGYFVFSNVPAGVPVSVSAEVPGYTVKSGGYRFSQRRNALPMGDKWFVPIYFSPAGRVKGYVVNAAGEQVPALIKVEGTGQIQETDDGYFNVNVASGSPARIVITPLDLRYFADTIVLRNPGEGVTDIGPQQVDERLHRINFVVTASTSDGASLAGTQIRVLDTVLTASSENLAGSGGASVRYSFANISQHNFWIKVIPPEGSGYVPRDLTITNHESKEYTTYVINLERGDSIWGTVTARGEPLPGAEVSVHQGNGAAVIRVLSDEQGSYKIDGLRTGEGELSVRVVPPQGDSIPGDPNAPAYLAGQTRQAPPNTAVDFELTGYDDLDLTALAGYRVRITDLRQEDDGAVVSGELLLPDDAEFTAFDDDRPLTFSDLRIRANREGHRNEAGIPYAEPEEDIVLDIASYRARFDEYNVLLQGAAGETAIAPMIVRKTGVRAGYLEVYARIVDNSFDFPSSYLRFSDSEFYFSAAGENGFSNRLQLPSVQHAATSARYHFSDASGNPLSFSFLGFDATSEVADNYFAGGEIHIRPEIRATIQTLGAQTLTIAMPEVRFNTTGIADITGEEPIEFKLENWTVHVAQWKAATEEGGITAMGTGNYIRTGAGLDLYFDVFRLTRTDGGDELAIDGVKAAGLKLGGFHPINVYPGSNTLFGLDTKTGNDLRPHYILRMTGTGTSMAGRIENLPGFSGGLEIQAVTLLSNGQQYVSFAPNSREVNVYDVISFRPDMLTDSEGGFVVSGNMDLGIPHMPGLSGGFEFTPGQGNATPKLTLQLKELDMEVKGNVVFHSDAVATSDNGRKILQPGRLEIWGTVTEPGKLDLIPVRLVKNVTNGQAKTDISLRSEGVYVMKIEGDRMSMDLSAVTSQVMGNTWDYLRFTGVMNRGFASGGFGGDPMTFIVHGDIALDEGSVSLTEIETGFGELTLVFDWQKKEMRGSIAIQRPGGGKIGFPGGVMAEGMAEILLSPQGFYFMAAVEAEIDPLPLISPFSAGFVIGYHDAIPQEVFEKATQHMYYKTYPCGEDGVAFKGFMFAGRKDIVKPVEFKIDFPPVATADIALEVGADVTLYTNFANGVHVALVVGAFGSAHLVLSHPMTCTVVSGSAEINLMGSFDYHDETFTGELCASLSIAGALKQSSPPFCEPEIFSLDKAIGIGARFGFEVSGDGVNPYFQLIKEACSAGAPCSVN